MNVIENLTTEIILNKQLPINRLFSLHRGAAVYKVYSLLISVFIHQ